MCLLSAFPSWSINSKILPFYYAHGSDPKHERMSKRVMYSCISGKDPWRKIRHRFRLGALSSAEKP